MQDERLANRSRRTADRGPDPASGAWSPTSTPLLPPDVFDPDPSPVCRRLFFAAD